MQLRWQLGEDAACRDDGKPWLVVKTYTASLNEKATLRKELERWRGQRFTEVELRGWDLEKVLNAPALLQIMHNETETGVFANVTAVLPLPKAMARPEVRDYVRQHLRLTDGIDTEAVHESLTATLTPQAAPAPSQRDAGASRPPSVVDAILSGPCPADADPDLQAAGVAVANEEERQVTAQVLVVLRALGYPDPQYQLDAICKKKGKPWATVPMQHKKDTLKALEAKLTELLNAQAKREE